MEMKKVNEMQQDINEIKDNLRKAHKNSREAGMLAVLALVICGIDLLIRLL